MMFEYLFMQRSFVVGIVLAIVIPCIGIFVVLRRLSMIGDALSHTSLAGVAAGLILGINPVLGALVACLVAAFGIEAIRKRMPHFGEVSIAVVASAGIGLAAVLSSFVGNSANFNSFLFGSIVAISNVEMLTVVLIGGVVFSIFILLYKEFFSVAFNERGARLSGVPVEVVNTIFTILTAVTVAIASRTVGALIVSSLMVVPVVCAMQSARSFRQTVVYAILSAVCFTAIGLTLSFYMNVRPGGAIVLVGVLWLVILLGAKSLRRLHAHMSQR